MGRKKNNLPAVALAGVVLVCAIAVAGGVLWFFGFLGSPQATRMVEDAVGDALRAEATISGLRAEGMVAAASLLELRGRADSLIDSLRAESISAPCKWRSLLKGNLHLHEIGAERLVVVFKDPMPAAGLAAEVAESKGGRSAFLVDRIELPNCDVSYKGFSANGVALSALKNSAGWGISGRGGILVVPGIPKLDISGFEISESSGIFALRSSEFRLGPGKVAATGSSAQPASLSAVFSGIPPELLVPALPAGRLGGVANGTVDLRAGQPVRGSFQISDAVLAGLPLLRTISDFLGDRSFREIRFGQFSADFEFAGGEWRLENITLSAPGKLALRGSARIGPGDRLRADLRLGVSDRILAALPGARQTVFTHKRDGFCWTPLELGGTTTHPTENLTARLAASIAGGFLIKQGTGAAEVIPGTAIDAAKGVLDILSPLIP